MYKQGDKVMLLETGEVLTVLLDFTHEAERGLVVLEKIGRNLALSEVRPAGRTRQRMEAGQGIVPPDPAPPVPIGCHFV
jgi:hypothetical protein